MRQIAYSGMGALLIALLSGRADAACTFPQIKYLLDGGFTREEVMTLCGPAAPQPAVPAAPTSQPGIMTYDTAGKTFGAGVLKPGTGLDGAWDRYFADQVYVLSNKDDGLSYYLLSSAKDRSVDWHEIGVRVRIANSVSEGNPVGGGLVFGERSDLISFVALLVDQDGAVTLTRADNGSFTQLASAKMEAISPEEPRFVQLSAVNEDGQVDFRLDGTSTGIRLPSDILVGATGIGAFGIGLFEFADFAVRSP